MFFTPPSYPYFGYSLAGIADPAMPSSLAARIPAARFVGQNGRNVPLFISMDEF